MQKWLADAPLITIFWRYLGGAPGRDYMAGMASLNAGGKTVVVAGCGADVTHPTTSAELLKQREKEGEQSFL